MRSLGKTIEPESWVPARKLHKLVAGPDLNGRPSGPEGKPPGRRDSFYRGGHTTLERLTQEPWQWLWLPKPGGQQEIADWLFALIAEAGLDVSDAVVARPPAASKSDVAVELEPAPLIRTCEVTLPLCAYD